MQDTIKVPTVRLAKPKARPIQLRYTDPTTKAEVRISTGTNDVDEALEQKAKLEARLLLGIESKPRKRAAAGPEMLWELFRERYAELQLNGLRPRSAESAELRLDMAERIMQPKTLGDLANSEALHQLQARLLAGECSRYGSRSAVTTRGYIVSAVAAMSFAATMGWIPAVPEIRKVKISKLRAMKGRAINGEEFDRLLDKVSSVVGEDAAELLALPFARAVGVRLTIGRAASRSLERRAGDCPGVAAWLAARSGNPGDNAKECDRRIDSAIARIRGGAIGDSRGATVRLGVQPDEIADGPACGPGTADRGVGGKDCVANRQGRSHRCAGRRSGSGQVRVRPRPTAILRRAASLGWRRRAGRCQGAAPRLCRDDPEILRGRFDPAKCRCHPRAIVCTWVHSTRRN